MDLFKDSLPPRIVLLQGLPPGALERLCPQERVRHEDFPAAKRKHDWLLGRLAGKEALRRALLDQGRHAPGDLDLPITSDPSGAPRTAGCAEHLALTITHGHGYAAAWAIEPGAQGGLPGLDLERIKKRPQGTFRFYMHPEERAWLEALAPGEDKAPGDRDLAAVVCWALKEAAFKALQPPRGTGLLDVGLELKDPLQESGSATIHYLNAAAPRAKALGVSEVEAGWERSGEFVLAWVRARGAVLPKPSI